MAIKVEGRLQPGVYYGAGYGNRKYDWSSWMDGDEWLLVQGVDFTVSAESFRQQAQSEARRRSRKATTRVTTEGGMPAVLLRAESRLDMQAVEPPATKEKPALHLPPPQHATAEDAIDQDRRGGGLVNASGEQQPVVGDQYAKFKSGEDFTAADSAQHADCRVFVSTPRENDSEAYRKIDQNKPGFPGEESTDPEGGDTAPVTAASLPSSENIAKN